MTIEELVKAGHIRLRWKLIYETYRLHSKCSGPWFQWVWNTEYTRIKLLELKFGQRVIGIGLHKTI